MWKETAGGTERRIRAARKMPTAAGSRSMGAKKERVLDFVGSRSLLSLTSQRLDMTAATPKGTGCSNGLDICQRYADMSQILCSPVALAHLVFAFWSVAVSGVFHRFRGGSGKTWRAVIGGCRRDPLDDPWTSV